MLLRQSEPADVDGYISAAAMGSPGHPQDATPRTDPLDDVFGSDGDSDTAVFEGEDDEAAVSHIRIARGTAGPAAQSHPSDMHRLRQEHTTAGYREGITVAKGASIQAGFDEGFGLGATIGLKVGYLLGVLEGVAAALSRDPSHASAHAEAARQLAEARGELGAQAVFSPEYWDSDGTWKYEVGGQGGQADDDEVVFSHVAEAHPLVRKWTSAVEAQMRKWGLEEEVPLLRRRDEEDAAAEPVARVKAVAQSQPDAKVANDALSW
ncbi:putative abc1 domain containing protein [Diaporthe ampelina]|uniref:Protein YAE1 n=1 Tax=Diaporthe ampelina TaxID=1214573 RepID=A0A0G2HSZ8_9PEZI|nr:putative abc1 domain containing protein [Diaporthe ampelina]